MQLKWKHQFQFAGYYQALEQGFYCDAGLDVTIREGGPGIDAAEAVAGGKADCGVCTSSVLRDWARAALVGYGVDFTAMFRRATVFVDKILKGTNPADIPIEQPTQFKTVINQKTAKALGVEIPPSLIVPPFLRR